jgi:hypothetical protein
VTEIEELLRDAYHHAADTIPPDDIRPAPHAPTAASRPGRFVHNFRLARPVLAAVAVLLVAAAATLIPQFLTHTAGPGNQHKPGLLRIARPGPPPSFFAVLTYNGRALEFFSTSTRKMTGIVVPPPRQVKQRTGTRNHHPQVVRYFSGVAAEPDNKTFIVAVAPFHVCFAHLYRVRIDSSGQPGPLLPMPEPAIQGLQGVLALSPDGSTLGYFVGRCPGSPEIVIKDSANGSTSTWTPREGEGISHLSLSAHGDVVGFSTLNFGGIGQPRQRSVTGLLRATGGSAVLDSAAVIVLHADAQVVLSPDGTILYACVERERDPNYELYAYDVASGKRLSVLASWPTERTNQAWPTLGSCDMTMAPDGAHILLGNVRGHLAIFSTVTGHMALSSVKGFNYADTLIW